MRNKCNMSLFSIIAVTKSIPMSRQWFTITMQLKLTNQKRKMTLKPELKSIKRLFMKNNRLGMKITQ